MQNDPADAEAVRQFKAFVDCFTLSASQRPDKPFPIKKFSDLKPASVTDLAVLDGAKFDLGPGPQASSGSDVDWVVRKVAGGQAVGLTRTQSSNCSAQTVDLRGGGRITAQIDKTVAVIDPRKSESVDVIVDGRKQPVTIDITFRSVDGMIYFLGEYARASRDGRAIYTVPRGSGPGEPLLLIAPGRGGRHDLSAELDGAAWHVPTDRPSRTWQVIALIEQLFNLHKAGSAAPLSTAVRVVN